MKNQPVDKECISCGEDISGSKSDYCYECRRELLRTNRHSKYKHMPLNQGNRARKLPPGYSDNPGYYGDDE